MFDVPEIMIASLVGCFDIRRRDCLRSGMAFVAMTAYLVLLDGLLMRIEGQC